MHFILSTLAEVWTVAQQMAPYLLFGFLMAGVLSVLITPELVERHLGGRGLWQVVKASLFGVPLPLCSCSVIPVAVSLRRHGASKGATLSFLASTPQTGVDSIMITHALLGPLFVVFRIVTAFASGLLAGTLDEWLERDAPAPARDAKNAACGCCGPARQRHPLYRMLHYGFVVLARDVGRAMLAGILISGLISALVPQNYFADKLGPGLVSMLVMLALGIPLYVCSSGSVPIAYALIHMGISPGAALVFLVSGPATNAAAVTTIWKTLGRRSTLIYLGAVSACALGAGLLMDLIAAGPTLAAAQHVHGGEAAWFGKACALVLAAVLLPGLLPERKRPRAPQAAADA